jgi:hypothetical protein
MTTPNEFLERARLAVTRGRPEQAVHLMLNALEALCAEQTRAAVADADEHQHPNGRCTCAGEGICAWCQWVGQEEPATQDIKSAMEAHAPAGHDEQRARDWLRGQQDSPEWLAAVDVEQWMLDAWPVWEVTFHSPTEPPSIHTTAQMLAWSSLSWAGGEKMRPLILPGMSIEAPRRAPRSGATGRAAVRLATHWRPAIFAQLDSEPSAESELVEEDACNCDQVAELRQQLTQWQHNAMCLADALAEVAARLPNGEWRARLMALAERLGAEQDVAP